MPCTCTLSSPSTLQNLSPLFSYSDSLLKGVDRNDDEGETPESGVLTGFSLSYRLCTGVCLGRSTMHIPIMLI